MKTGAIFLVFGFSVFVTVLGQGCPRCARPEKGQELCGCDDNCECKTFKSGCLLLTENCFRPLKFMKVHDGECESETKNGALVMHPTCKVKDENTKVDY